MHNGRRNAQRSVLAEAADKSASALRTKDESSGRKFADVEIVIRSVGELFYFMAIDARLKNAPSRIWVPNSAVLLRIAP